MHDYKPLLVEANMGIGKLAITAIQVGKYVGAALGTVAVWEVGRRTVNHLRKPAATPAPEATPPK